MRPFSALLAVAYVLSFVAVCLGGCMGAAPAEHGCCQDQQGLKSAQAGKDCCTVVPGLAGKCVPSAVTPVETSAAVPAAIAVVTAAAHTLVPLPAAASPPLILRI
jgi:hypothetical protein